MPDGFLRYCPDHGYFMDRTSDQEAEEYAPCPLPHGPLPAAEWERQRQGRDDG